MKEKSRMKCCAIKNADGNLLDRMVIEELKKFQKTKENSPGSWRKEESSLRKKSRIMNRMSAAWKRNCLRRKRD